MSDGVPGVLVAVTAVMCGVSGGTFFAFSTIVMSGLGRLPGSDGAAAMRAINRGENNPLFLLGVLGPVLPAVVTAVLAVRRWGEPGTLLVLVGAVLFVVGAVVVTMAFHVPRNTTLAGLDPSLPETATYWARYLAEWTALNHVRTVAGVAAAAAYTAALFRG